MTTHDPDRAIHLEATVTAPPPPVGATAGRRRSIALATERKGPVAEVWRACTTPEGIKTFFAQEYKVLGYSDI